MLFSLFFILGPPLNDIVKPLSWLLGKWRSENGHGKYPTIKDFRYGEELEFSHVGQPNIQFRYNLQFRYYFLPYNYTYLVFRDSGIVLDS